MVSEAWVLNKKLEEKLLTWERKILRRIYGGKKVAEGYERRENKAFYDLYGEANILEVIKGRRLDWLGHTERISDTRVVKQISDRQQKGTRKKGRPRLRWRQRVLQDIEERKIKNWKREARDKKI